MQNIPNQYVRNLYRALFTVLCILAAFIAVKIITEVKGYRTVGSQYANTISFSGHGEVQAVPDIATISFNVKTNAPTQKAAADAVNTKTQKVIDFLKSSNIDEKDIKTDNYIADTNYSNPVPCYSVQSANGMIIPPCRTDVPKVIGYVVSQGITVKIRNIDDSSKIIDGINAIGVEGMYGPNFAVDNQDALQEEARKDAINDAKAKADSLAEDLGVHLGRITSFNESGNYPLPMYAAKDSVMSAQAGNVSAELPKGQNTLSSDVTITYEIK